MKLPRLHIHRDPNWSAHGAWAYYRCRCGALRVRRLRWHIHGPVEAGWPRPFDHHGRPIPDSGWVKS